jgi:hypothetical protein
MATSPTRQISQSRGASVELLIDGQRLTYIPYVSTDATGHFSFGSVTPPSNFRLDLIAAKEAVGTAKLSTHKRNVPPGAHFVLALER